MTKERALEILKKGNLAFGRFDMTPEERKLLMQMPDGRLSLYDCLLKVAYGQN